MKVMNDLANYFLSRKNEKPFVLLLFFILCFFSYVIYYDAIFYGESSYDDPIYFEYLRNLFNDGVTLTAFFPIFYDYVNSNYHPLTVLSLAIDFIIGGGNPVFFHVTNIVIHICNAMMIFLIFNNITRYRMAAVLTALLFFIHPLNVESVIWISERKGLLSVLFALISFYYYVEYKKEVLQKYKVTSVIFFILSLLSKPTTATIPALFILLDLTVFNENAKINLRMIFDSVKDKIPYVVTGLSIIIFAFLAQIEKGALSDLATVTVSSRLETSINNIFIYISKIFLPVNLATYYPHPEKSIYEIILYMFFISSWVFLAIKYFSKSKLITFCVIFFFVQIIPLSGLFQTGSHSIANRYTYLPAIGMFFIVAFFINKTRDRYIATFISFVLVVSLTVVTSNHAKVWKSNLSLWENNAKVTDKNYYTAYFYSMYLIENNQIDEALGYFYNIIGISNRYYADEAISGFAVLLTHHKKYNEAKAILDEGKKHKFPGAGIHRQLALLEYFYFGNKVGGEQLIKGVLKYFPLDLRANRIYSKILFDQKKYKEALGVLNAMKRHKEKRNEDFKQVIEDDIKLIKEIFKDEA